MTNKEIIASMEMDIAFLVARLEDAISKIPSLKERDKQYNLASKRNVKFDFGGNDYLYKLTKNKKP